LKGSAAEEVQEGEQVRGEALGAASGEQMPAAFHQTAVVRQENHRRN
jgi:hypothetical protein